ncbi:MAG: Ig-like domain-containing protein [Oscillibacter sp.]|nr:Ig-like domain-containing protein [Oscillibacter sp.]
MEKVKKTSGGSGVLTVSLILLVLALAGGIAYVIFGIDVVPGLGDRKETEVRQEQTAEAPLDGEETAGSQNPNFVPIILPEGAGENGDDLTPFAQAAPAGGETGAPEAGGAGTEGGTTEAAAGADTAEPSGGEPASPEPAPEPAAPPASVDYATANKRPKGLAMSTEDFTVTKIGQKTQLSASGGAGVYNWISQNPAVATVDASGLVTAVSAGTTNILATDGVVKGVAIVRVKALSDEFSLNKTDFTRSIGEGPYQLKLSGYDGAILWTSSNTAVAAVAPDGTVTPVGPGFAVITAAWEDHSRQCFVHVTE